MRGFLEYRIHDFVPGAAGIYGRHFDSSVFSADSDFDARKAKALGTDDLWTDGDLGANIGADLGGLADRRVRLAIYFLY